jgi:hypothetical protein
MTDNVILFPGFRREDAPPQNLDEIHDKVTQTRKEHVAGVMNDMIPDVINMFGAYGVDINDDKYIKDVALVMESIKALLHRQYNLEHPFHNISDNIFEFKYNEDSTIEYTYTYFQSNDTTWKPHECRYRRRSFTTYGSQFSESL